MNNLTVDGQILAVQDIAGANLEEILISLMEHPVTTNRVITEVKVNGSRYSEEVPHAALDVVRASIETLELSTSTAESLSLHFLKHGHYFTATLREALPKIVENFRMGDESEANEHFLSFLESLHLLINMLSQIKQAMGLGEEIELGEIGSLRANMDKLADILTTMVTLQEQSDWIFLADVLEYELDAVLEELAALMPLLSKAGH